MAALVGITTGADAYNEARERGKNQGQALVYGVPHGVFEYVFEKIPAAKMFGDMAAGKGLLKTMAGQALPEVWTEQLTTIAQDFNTWMNLNPNKTIKDFAAERPEAAYQTFVATLVGVGLRSGAAHGINRAMGGAIQRQEQAQQAEQHAQVLESMQATMQASKLLERSPESLRSYAQDLADEGVPTVYVNSAKLVEAGVDLQALAQAMPSVAAQLEQAQTGGDLAIPTGELLTNSIGTAFAQPLIDHARTDVNGMSREEARVFMQEKGDALNAEIERVMAVKESDAEFKAGRDQVQAQILTQLNDIKRFTGKVNEQYATLAANFYAVMAARSGMTVQDFSDKYKLGFNANEVAGGMYDQLFDLEGLPNQGRELIREQAEALAVRLKSEGFEVELGHSGSAAGPSSYLKISDPQTGMRLTNDVRLSGHSKGAFNSQFVHNVNSGEFDGLIAELKALRTPERIAAHAQRGYSAARMLNEREAKAIAIRLKSADKKLAKGKMLTKSEQEAVDARGLGGKNTLNQAQIDNPKTGVSAVLLTLGQNDDLYQYPRSDALDVRDIAADKSWVNDKGEVATVQVSDVDKNSDNNKLWMLANTTPDDDASAGTKSWILTLPTGKYATLTQKGGEVYINVSGVGEGNGGSAVYDLAANYALNNGLVFVGDPNGVSAAAMRRRLENMLSSAIKYGTTDHLKPHPDQYLGDVSIGVPPLDWTNGDTLGNIRAMVDVSIASTEHLNPNATGLAHFDNATQSFVDGEGHGYSNAELSALLEADDRARGTGQGGVRTLQRAALFKSLVQSEGARRAFLESVRGQQGGGSANPSGALAGTFYQGDIKPAGSPYETDLFGNPLPAPARKAGSAARRSKAKGGDVHAPGALRDTPAPAGDYHVRTVVGAETNRKLGSDQVTIPVELARATAYLYRSAVERFDGIVTDKDGKPLGVIGGFKGAISQTSVYPGTMVAEAVRIPGAAHVWFSHNHPSGNSGLSNADLNLARTLADVFRGSGIEPEGLMAVSGGQFSFTRDGAAVDHPQPFDAPTTETPVPVVEREQLPPKSALAVVASPQDAKSIAAAYYAQSKTPGVILLTAQSHVAAWVPVSPEMMGTLRYTGGLGAIYRAVSESNAEAAIIVHGGELGTQGNLPAGNTPSANIAAALAKVDVQPLDSINIKTNASAAEQGQRVAASTLFQESRGQIAFGNDITQQASIIGLFKNADLSTFIHESGHFFLEVQTDLANRIAARAAQGEVISEGERSILDDMNKTLDWMGVKATPEMSALDHWAYLSAEEKRPYHEQWARGFEAYAFEGKAPSLDLQHAFQTFRAWLVNVYRALLKSVNASKTDIAGAMKVELSDEVRSVMDRMLATSDAIAEAEAARDMGPLFKTAEQAGMTLDEFKAYHDQGTQATMDAVDELQARGLRDMQWLNNARSRKLKELQKQHDALRAQIAREVRAEVLSRPIYRAWTFLISRATDKVVGEKSPDNAKGLNPEVDNLFTAIAKLGGLDRAEVLKLWGIDEKEKLESGVFGMPVVRKTGGLSTDAMAKRLLENGYLLPDEHGKADAAKFEELFDDQRRGTDRYSISRDMAAAYGDAPLNTPELPEVGYGKLATEELRRRYGVADDAVWRKLSALRMTSDDGGLNPDVVGELFGFSSGDELVKTLAVTEPPKSVIEGMVDTRMLHEHGDLATPAGLERAADAAIHNDARARFVATELKALQKAMSVREKVPGQKNTVDVLARAARDYATAIIAKLRVRDIRPGQYAAAEVRSAKAAKAVGDIARATLHKRNQLINLYAAKAAYAAQDEVKAAVQYFKKFDTVSKALDPEYAEQIHALLERFDLRASTSLRAIDKRKSLVEWMEGQAELGLEPSIPDELLQEANRKSFKEMTVEEVRGLRDTIKQIEHIGRLKNKLLLARDKREFDAVAAEMAASIVDNGGNVKPLELEGPKPVMDWFAGFAASHRKIASLFRQMDGNNDIGPIYSVIGRSMNERGTIEEVMIEKATQTLQAMYAPLLKLSGGITGYKSKVFIPEINASLTRGGRLAVALNWGNEANRQRIMDGDNWSDAQVQAILQTLTPQELAFVNATWEYLDSYWPEVAAKEKRLTGIEPEKVEAAPFIATAADGTKVLMRGGYYPLKYDANRSDRTSQQDAAQVAKEMMQGAFTRATTRRGHTKARVDTVNRAVRKDLNVITQHVTQVVHDLAWHEWLIDTNRLLGDKRVAGAIRSHYGPQILKTMRDSVMGIATADVAQQTALDQALLQLRSNVTRATMGASLTTAFLQPFGLTQSMVRIGPKHVLRGVARWGGDAARMESTVGWINEKSDFMRLRGTTFNKELREIRGSVAGKSKAMQAVDGGLFYLMRKMQAIADVPTWVGQYEKSISQGLDESAAVAMADRAVIEAQGGGQTKDLAEIQRKHPLLTQFYSYFSVTLNLTAEQTAKTDFKNPRAVAGWLGDMSLLLVIPAILPAILMHAIKGGEDDDPETWIKRLARWQLGYLMGMVVGLRELSGAVGGFDYAGPPVGRIVADITRATKQTAQGEIDDPLVFAYINLMGTTFGIPTVQALRSYKGWKAWDEGQEGAGPQSPLFGPPPKD
ncbi:JAB domain-containing protein [Rhodoferax sp.]|uniref:JAB domain-containing protein n=1 Tax=Rhodoferax sp. TaxID=50421 RepID=UPI002ACE897A|nr:JAB domain-containing protein [Rhodoferax sp.]MDZ7918520.1 JAB domain-containing protein [Rhodoferax sp.]